MWDLGYVMWILISDDLKIAYTYMYIIIPVMIINGHRYVTCIDYV